jgi:hypothetical protein
MTGNKNKSDELIISNDLWIVVVVRMFLGAEV